MSELGDDLIQSLKEAVAHAKGEGPGTEHAPERPRSPKADEPQARPNGTVDEASQLRATGPASQSECGSQNKTM